MEDPFQLVEQAISSGGAEAAFQLLAERFLQEKNYPLVLETRLMRKRHELGIPLIQHGPPIGLSDDQQRLYDDAFIAAARHVGHLYLSDGDIPRAWPYFRAIGETAPVAEAIDQVQPAEGIEPVIEIALLEGVHPVKGFELILAHHGICRAITCFGQYPASKGRDECARMLVNTLHCELVDNLKRSIAQAEGAQPDTNSIPDLITGRDWLFGEYSYHVDTSHLVSVLQISLEMEEPEILAKALDMAAYGARLAPMFHHRGQPPFEDVYSDHAIFLRALLGRDEDAAIAHFRARAEAADPDQDGSASAQVLVSLLARLRRYPEAIDASLRHLADVPVSQLACPSVFELCQLAGDHSRLTEIARQRGDLLSFAAAAIGR